MKKTLLSISSFLFWANFCFGQAPATTTFSGDLTSVLALNDPNGPNVGGSITLSNGIQLNDVIGGHETRVFKSIDFLNDASFNASCDVKLSNGSSPGHIVMAFTAGTLDVLSTATGTSCYDDISTYNCTYTNTNQSAIEIFLFNPNIGFDSNIQIDGTAISVYTKIGNSGHVLASTAIPIPANAISNFKVQFTRTSLTTGIVVCIDNSTGLEIGKSNVVIPATITGLNTFQSGVNTSSNKSRSLTGNFNNIIINNCILLPAPTVSTNPICEGNSTNLTASTATSNPLFSWFSDASGGTAISNSNIYSTPILNTNTTYYVSYSSNAGAGCSSPRTSATVTVNKKSIVGDFSILGNTTNCPGSSTTYTISPVLADTRYYWIVDSGLSVKYVNSQSTQITAYFPDMPGAQYTIKALAINSCGNTNEESLPISITKDLPNKPKLTCSNNDNCATLNLQTEPTSGESVSWNNGGTIIENITSITRAIDKQVYVTFSKNGCSYTDTYIPQICVDGTPTTSGISNPSVITDFALYPNPNNGVFSFESKGGIGKAFVINSLGVVLFDMSLEESKTKYDVNLSNLPSGIYILKVSEGDNSNSTSFIVK